ncbi:hypothetical protein GGI25_000443 [Coemansia spiralis]|uniref:Uncharacterized protein n=1 Tax=Coemansia spiralis TaxID=417178 RepID=A0A9W8GCV4_9FUNG|nr:hypothetical protein GGI25_000443 [Coemansia spiralis]
MNTLAALHVIAMAAFVKTSYTQSTAGGSAITTGFTGFEATQIGIGESLAELPTSTALVSVPVSLAGTAPSISTEPTQHTQDTIGALSDISATPALAPSESTSVLEDTSVSTPPTNVNTQDSHTLSMQQLTTVPSQQPDGISLLPTDSSSNTNTQKSSLNEPSISEIESLSSSVSLPVETLIPTSSKETASSETPVSQATSTFVSQTEDTSVTLSSPSTSDETTDSTSTIERSDISTESTSETTPILTTSDPPSSNTTEDQNTSNKTTDTTSSSTSTSTSTSSSSSSSSSSKGKHTVVAIVTTYVDGSMSVGEVTRTIDDSSDLPSGDKNQVNDGDLFTSTIVVGGEVRTVTGTYAFSNERSSSSSLVMHGSWIQWHEAILQISIVLYGALLAM